MSKESFYILCDELRPHITKNTTQIRKSIDIEKQVAVVLYYLADECPRKKTANAFGVVKCTVSKIFYRVTKAINRYLAPKFIEVSKSCRLFWKNMDFCNVLEL